MPLALSFLHTDSTIIKKLDALLSISTLSLASVKLGLRPKSDELSVGRDTTFRNMLLQFYESDQRQPGMLQCMVLGVFVPREALVAGHIFPLRHQVSRLI